MKTIARRTAPGGLWQMYARGRRLQRTIESRGGPPAHLRDRYERAVAALDGFQAQADQMGFFPVVIWWIIGTAVAALAGIAVYTAVRVQPQVEESSKKLIEAVTTASTWSLYAIAGLVGLGIYQRIAKGRNKGPRKTRQIMETIA